MAGYLPSVGSRSDDGYFGGGLVVGERLGDCGLTRRTGLALRAACGCRSRFARLRIDEAHRPRPTGSYWLSVSLRSGAD
jgi:hypothetical protein